ncbi:PepSY domain-containing protein [Nonomuraea sp. NPDC049152]|uniref:PepSY domain-containing protein n=1 Tax=Nonomuraea sp. NPDC049152 TaxID=3154350 RepID=UPI0033F99C8E
MNGGKRTKTIIGTIFVGSVLLGAASCGTDSPESGTAVARHVPAPAPGGAFAGLLSPSGAPSMEPSYTMEPSGAPSMEPSGAPSMGAGDMESLQKAGMAAVEAVEGSTLISIEAQDNGKTWEVHVVGTDGTEHSMDVDAESGNVASGPTAEKADEAEKAKRMTMVKSAMLTYKEAAEKATESVPEGKINELYLDRHMGKVAWEAVLMTPDGTKHEVYVDAKDGTVTKNGSTS